MGTTNSEMTASSRSHRRSMSAIESLLGPDPGAHAGQPARTPRTLLVGTDVLIHLQEDESREEVTLYSVPGVMQEVAWLSECTEAWSSVLPHPANEKLSAHSS